jgi:hypothetical protein
MQTWSLVCPNHCKIETWNALVAGGWEVTSDIPVPGGALLLYNMPSMSELVSAAVVPKTKTKVADQFKHFRSGLILSIEPDANPTLYSFRAQCFVEGEIAYLSPVRGANFFYRPLDSGD